MPLRPATDGDRDAVLALGLAEEAAWFGEPEISAGELGEWIDEEGGLGPGVVCTADDDAVRGFASPGRHHPVFLADPGDVCAVADELLPWLLERSPKAELETYAGDAERAAAFERHGLRHIRSSFSLARPAGAGPVPAAQPPGGVTIEPYALGAEDEAVHRTIYVDAAWAAVPGHTERDLAAWREATGNAGLLLVARRDGAPVGFVSARVLESGRGYVPQLAVARAERGRGTGRALLLAAFAALQAAGAGDLTLGVMAENEGALGLYRSVGLEIEREFRAYARSAGSTDSP